MITAVPERSVPAVTLPDPSTLALPLLLLHVPPATASVNAIVLPAHTFVVAPVIGAGAVLTVNNALTLQPLALVYTIVDVPADDPAVTTPVEDPIVTADPLAVHVPPDVVLLSVVVAPAHIASEPRIEAGCVLTVTPIVVLQPPAVYVIVKTPLVEPVTIPDNEPIGKFAELLLLQVPPPVRSLSVVVEPLHICWLPSMAPGAGLSVSVLVTVQPSGDK